MGWALGQDTNRPEGDQDIGYSIEGMIAQHNEVGVISDETDLPHTASKVLSLFSEQAAEIGLLKSVLNHIAVKCVDYDGYTTVEGLKELIDTIATIVAELEPLDQALKGGKKMFDHAGECRDDLISIQKQEIKNLQAELEAANAIIEQLQKVIPNRIQDYDVFGNSVVIHESAMQQEEIRNLELEIERLEKRRGGECSICGKWVCPPLTCYGCRPPEQALKGKKRHPLDFGSPFDNKESEE